jgi:GT2 family glycosyltransferase
MAYSAIVVAHDHPRQLLGALLSLRSCARPDEVIVVDNGSRADLRGVIALSRLPVRYLRLHENRSLGAAYNAGLDATTGEAALLLHSDVLLETDPAVAADYLRADATVGVVGAKLMQQSEPPRRVMHAGYELGRGRVGPKLLGRGDWDKYHDPVDVPAVSGACMMLRWSDLRFDERYWFRLEDVDLCLQYRQRGFGVTVLPALTAVHLEQGGVAEHGTDIEWGRRQVASQWLYHERWCCDTPLEQLPPRGAERPSTARLVEVIAG